MTKAEGLDHLALAGDFPADKVHWRIGATGKNNTIGLALAYIDARDVMDRLDEVVGPACWQCRYPDVGNKTICEIGILITRGAGAAKKREWVWKADGAGDTAVEADKGALSDAFKRAAVRWGVGRYLYGMPSPWVGIEKQGSRMVIKPSELLNLHALLEGKDTYHLGKSQKKTELKDNLRAFIAAFDEADTSEKLANLLDEHAETLRLCEHDMPTWWDGDQTEDFVPLKHRIDAKTRFLEAQGL